MRICRIIHDLIQMVTGSQIGLAQHTLSGVGIVAVIRREQQLSQGIIVDIRGYDTGARINVMRAAVIGHTQATAAVIINKDEVQCLLVAVGNIAGGDHGPGLRVTGGCDRGLRPDRMEIEQIVVVKHVGGDKAVGADCICHLGIELTNIVGACHPIRIQNRIAGDRHLGAG